MDQPHPPRGAVGERIGREFGGSLRDVFYYITFVCNLRCRHCYVGENLAPASHADPQAIAENLGACRRAGARKLTLLGGEPTLHPDYRSLLVTARELGFERLIVDTSGHGRFPLPDGLDLKDRLAVRFSFDGLDAPTHDAIRGRGCFARVLDCLRRVAAAGYQTEATFTVSAMNRGQVPSVVRVLAAEGVGEVNFHVVSRTGNAKAAHDLGLAPEEVLQVQAELEEVRRTCAVPVRFPRLLIPAAALPAAIAEGLACRLHENSVLLLFPDGTRLRCPLEITPALGHGARPESTGTFRGCPLADKLFPAGVPQGHAMTCISWKEHRPA